MDSQSNQEIDQPTEGKGFDPSHLWAKPGARVNLDVLRKHQCMVNIVQKDGYIHCYNGNHGMKIPPGKILVKKDGVFTIEDVVILEPANIVEDKQ